MRVVAVGEVVADRGRDEVRGLVDVVDERQPVLDPPEAQSERAAPGCLPARARTGTAPGAAGAHARPGGQRRYAAKYLSVAIRWKPRPGTCVIASVFTAKPGAQDVRAPDREDGDPVAGLALRGRRRVGARHDAALSAGRGPSACRGSACASGPTPRRSARRARPRRSRAAGAGCAPARRGTTARC